MTRDQFIDAYMQRSRLNRCYRTAVGFHVDGSEPRIAVKCSCNFTDCEGWEMLRLEDLDDLNLRSLQLSGAEAMAADI